MSIPKVPLLPLSCQYLSRDAVFVLDIGWTLLLYITVHAPRDFFTDILGKKCIANKRRLLRRLVVLDNIQKIYI